MFGKKPEIPTQQKSQLNTEQGANLVSLKMICVELKIDPREAREKLRIAARDSKKYPDLAKSRKAGEPWQWQKGSNALSEARSVLAN